jgi:uncharacterized protein YyaL (SSP411 family)
MGRLGDAISPYLRSHANQPVDWFGWGADAFAEAKRRDVPLLISIGYHTCHWCHVMSRECFQDPDIARVINDTVVAVKVDREEHPEVDQVYMAQASAFAENLGWPLTVFTTPQGQVFYAATYLPPVARDGLPSLGEVVKAVGTAWSKNRDDVVASAKAVTEALSEAVGNFRANPVESAPSHQQLAAVVQELEATEDRDYGGFGGAPKFPVAPVLRFLQGQADAGNDQALALVTRVLQTLAGSPLRDPVEGGFFRYATRRDFSEPHYERMLYDNAGLLALYSNAGMSEVAEGIISFFRHQLLVGQALGSAQDSESIIEGTRNEGGYYQRDAQQRRGLEPPEVDSKIITGLNGLALEALALAHRADMGLDPGQLGTEIAWWLLANHRRDDGQLIRLSNHDRISHAPATAEDYGGFALGLIELGLATGNVEFVSAGKELVDHVRTGGLDDTGDPVLRAQGIVGLVGLQEGSSPSGEALLALAALRLAALTGDVAYREFASGQVMPHVADAMLQPLGHGGILRVLSELASAQREVIVVADGASELVGTIKRWRLEGALALVLNSEQARAFVAAGFGLLEGRVDGSTPIAYVCEAGVCRLPVTSASELRELLAG